MPVPRGTIVMWPAFLYYKWDPSTGADEYAYYLKPIPAGWTLCNGSNGTPDLRRKFIRGSGGEFSIGNQGPGNVGATVVANDHVHDVSDCYFDNNGFGHSHVINRQVPEGGGGTAIMIVFSVPGGGMPPEHTHQIMEGCGAEPNGHQHGASGNTQGSDTAVTVVLPNYCITAFIMKL
jgi:hypothetical protein